MYRVYIFTDRRAWEFCPDCSQRTLRASLDCACAEIGMPWKVCRTDGSVVAHGDDRGRTMRIADLPLPLTERLLLWCQREFNPKHVQRVYADLVDVAAGNRAGNRFEREALALLS